MTDLSPPPAAPLTAEPLTMRAANEQHFRATAALFSDDDRMPSITALQVMLRGVLNELDAERERHNETHGLVRDLTKVLENRNREMARLKSDNRDMREDLDG